MQSTRCGLPILMCLSVGHKTTELIIVPFGLWWNQKTIIRWGPDPARGRINFGGISQPTVKHSMGNIRHMVDIVNFTQ